MTTRSVFVAALVWAVVVVVVVHFLSFPGSVPDFVRASGGGTLLDASPAFTADAVYDRLDEYGDVGRGNYSFRNVTVDIVLPLSVLPFLYLLMRKAVTPVAIGRLLRRTLLLVPFVYVLFDLIENSMVLVLLRNYPTRLDMLAGTLAYATIIKRVASLLAIGVPLTMLGVNAVRRLAYAKR